DRSGNGHRPCYTAIAGVAIRRHRSCLGGRRTGLRGWSSDGRFAWRDHPTRPATGAGRTIGAVSIMRIATPYLVFLGAVANPRDAKTGQGLVDWRRESCVAQFRYPGCAADL